MATDTTTATTSPASSTSSGSAPALIVTSGASRSNYANNVNTLNTATSNLSSNNPSVVDFLNNNKMPSDYNSRASMAKQYGIQNYTGSADQNTQLLGILRNGQTKDTTTPDNQSKIDALTKQVSDLQGKAKAATDAGYGVNDEIKYDASENIISKNTTTNADGTTTDESGTARDAIDPSLRNVFDTSMASLDEGINTAKNNLSTALATLKNDPAATAAINMIMQKYDQQIETMKAKNRMLLGSDVVNAARGGSLQYANEMETNFMSEEQDKASQRVTDLITLETSMILKAKQAYEKGDLDAFNAASKALDAANKGKTDAIDKLLTQTDKIVKEKQADLKIKAAAAKQQTTDNLRVSTGLAKTVADSIAKSGIKDPAQIDAYIAEMAKNSGISDPNILKSAVVKAQQDQSKLDLSAANTKSMIAKRGTTGGGSTKGGGKDGGFTYTGDDITAYASFLNQGGKSNDGKVFGARGTDKFANTGTYLAAYEDWVGKNNGTTKGFLKQFPIATNVNPNDYSSLPEALRPKTTKAAAGFK